MCKYRVTYHSHHRNFSAVCMRTLIFVAIRPLNRQQQRHGRWYPEGGECGCSAAHAAPPAPPPSPPGLAVTVAMRRRGSRRGNVETSRNRRIPGSGGGAQGHPVSRGGTGTRWSCYRVAGQGQAAAQAASREATPPRAPVWALAFPSAGNVLSPLCPCVTLSVLHVVPSSSSTGTVGWLGAWAALSKRLVVTRTAPCSVTVRKWL